MSNNINFKKIYIYLTAYTNAQEAYVKEAQTDTNNKTNRNKSRHMDNNEIYEFKSGSQYAGKKFIHTPCVQLSF
jgi:hypothetical protein